MSTVATEVLSTHTPALFAAAVRRAADLLRAGQVVALPTETVYGLAANALDEAAVARIFAVKGRPAHNPIIVHVASMEMARACASQWPEVADRLAGAFWPGPLTMVVAKAASIPGNVTAGGMTVGIRWPSHPFMQAVIRECGFPLAAPSANPSNQISPTNADHVREHLDGRIPLIVDGGQSQVGIESTVLDITTTPAGILRPGMIHEGSLRAVTGLLEHGGKTDAGRGETLRSPGALPKHYSPKAKMLLLRWTDEADLSAELTRQGVSPELVHVLAHTHIPLSGTFKNVHVIPHDAEAFARALYGELHRCDAEHATWVVVEDVPDTIPWRAIADRLRRAAA